MKAAVIGGGPMGLTAAMALARKGIRVTLYEADSVLGGMSASFDFDGVLMERYYHFINRPDESLFSLLRELGMERKLCWTTTKMGMFCPPAKRKAEQGRLLPWDGPLALLRFPDAPLATRLRYGLHIMFCKYIRNLASLDRVSAKDWICRWEGTEGYDILWRFLFEKKFFAYADPLSAAWIASRVQRVARSRSGFKPEQLGYLEGGTQSLLDRMAAVISEHGGRIRLSTPVQEALPQDGASVLVRAAETEESFDLLISTIPLPYVADIMPGLPAGYLSRTRAVLNVGCACALFRLRQRLTPFFWLNASMPGWDVPGIIEFSNLKPMDATYVYVPFYMPHSHLNWTSSEAALLGKARTYLQAINPEAAKTEEAARLFRYEWAQPVCPPGFGRLLPDIYSGEGNIFVADTSHSFPQDRSVNESIRIGKELAGRALSSKR